MDENGVIPWSWLASGGAWKAEIWQTSDETAVLACRPAAGAGRSSSLGVVGISIILPSCDFVDEGLFAGDATVEILRRENGEFGFRHIEPTAVLWRIIDLLHNPFFKLGVIRCRQKGGGDEI